MNRNQEINDWQLWAKRLMFVGTFTVPFYIILPTSAGIYEIFMLISALCLIFSKTAWTFPDKDVFMALLLMWLGYTLSLWNAVNIFEGLKFTLQFLFIITIQAPVILTLTRTSAEFRNHAYALFLALTVLVVYFIIGISIGSVKIGSYSTLIYGNYNNTASVLLVLLIPSLFLFYYTEWKRDWKRSSILFSIILIGTIAMFSTQSRRIYPAVIGVLVIIFATSFLKILEPKRIIKRGIVGSLMVLLIGLGIIQNNISVGIFSRMQQTVRGENTGGGIQERIEFVEVGISVIIELFPLGTGYNNYGYYATTSEPHNLFVEPFAEGGILAGIGVVLLFMIIIVRSIRKIYATQNWDPVAASFSITTIGFVLAYMFGTLLIFRVFWLIPILAVGFINNQKCTCR